MLKTYEDLVDVVRVGLFLWQLVTNHVEGVFDTGFLLSNSNENTARNVSAR